VCVCRARVRAYLCEMSWTPQEQLIAHMKASHSGILDTIVAKGAIDDATDKTMKENFSKFTNDFSA